MILKKVERKNKGFKIIAEINLSCRISRLNFSTEQKRLDNKQLLLYIKANDSLVSSTVS